MKVKYPPLSTRPQKNGMDLKRAPNKHANVRSKYEQTTGRKLYADAGQTQPFVPTCYSRKKGTY